MGSAEKETQLPEKACAAAKQDQPIFQHVGGRVLPALQYVEKTWPPFPEMCKERGGMQARGGQVGGQAGIKAAARGRSRWATMTAAGKLGETNNPAETCEVEAANS